jgi:hypothetical protein
VILGPADPFADAGYAEILELGAGLVLNFALTFAALWTDERYLAHHRPDLLERAWPSSTRLSAAMAFGPLCLPIHYWRTSSSLARRMLGLGAAAAVIVVVQIVVVLIDLLATERSW